MHDDNLAGWIGSAISGARREHRWGQRELARRLGVSQSAIARLELGELRRLDADLATAALRELGIRTTFDARTLGLASRREQKDLVHAVCLGSLARVLRRDGWETRAEVEIGTGRYRGWIDLLSYRSADRALLVTEYKSQLRDVGAVERTVHWYLREAGSAARRLGWQPRQASAALILLASDENDAAVVVNRSALRLAFPGSTTELAAWLRAPGAAPPPALGMFDPRSRRSTWLVGTRSDGRRMAAAYRDYADAARALSRRR